MNILLDSVKLENLLLRKKSYIGIDSNQALANVISGIGLGFGTYGGVMGLNADLLTAVVRCMGLTLVGYGGWKMVQAKRAAYSSELLLRDIEDLNEITHPFSIINIQDTFMTYPHRYLLRYDVDWACYLFPSFPTKLTEADNQEYLKKVLANALEVPINHLTLSLKEEIIQRKFSEKDKVQKRYDHKFYQCQIQDMPKRLQADTFIIGGVNYKWMTIEAMQQDTNIMNKNRDVVDVVSRL